MPATTPPLRVGGDVVLIVYAAVAAVESGRLLKIHEEQSSLRELALPATVPAHAWRDRRFS